MFLHFTKPLITHFKTKPLLHNIIDNSPFETNRVQCISYKAATSSVCQIGSVAKIMKSLVLITILVSMCCAITSAIMFNLEPNTQKCLRDEMQAHQLVLGEYEITDAPGQKIDYVIRDSKGHILSQKEHINKGKFSFTSELFENYEICFISRVPQHQRGVVQEVSLSTKKGIDTKNYEGIGEAAKLKPLEVDLKRIEDLSDSIVQDFVHMRKQEEEMRDTNESTNNRVLFFSIFSMCCLLGLATWQVLYLRRFFKAKKLIE